MAPQGRQNKRKLGEITEDNVEDNVEGKDKPLAMDHGVRVSNGKCWRISSSKLLHTTSQFFHQLLAQTWLTIAVQQVILPVYTPTEPPHLRDCRSSKFHTIIHEAACPVQSGSATAGLDEYPLVKSPSSADRAPKVNFHVFDSFRSLDKSSAVKKSLTILNRPSKMPTSTSRPVLCRSPISTRGALARKTRLLSLGSESPAVNSTSAPVPQGLSRAHISPINVATKASKITSRLPTSPPRLAIEREAKHIKQKKLLPGQTIVENAVKRENIKKQIKMLERDLQALDEADEHARRASVVGIAWDISAGDIREMERSSRVLRPRAARSDGTKEKKRPRK